MKNDIGIVFIHGAGLGGYIWKDLLPLIGNSALALEFPNRGADDKANSSLRFDDYVSKAISEVESFDKQKLVIVTHSIGGLVGLRLATHFEKELIGFVGIASAIPKKGDSFLSCLPFPQRIILPLIMRLAGTRPPNASIEKSLCHGLDAIHCQEVKQKFTAESKQLFLERSEAPIPDVKTLYVCLEQDKEFPSSVQLMMAEHLNCNNIRLLDTGHLPMISAPEELAAILNDFIDSSIKEIELQIQQNAIPNKA